MNKVSCWLLCAGIVGYLFHIAELIIYTDINAIQLFPAHVDPLPLVSTTPIRQIYYIHIMLQILEYYVQQRRELLFKLGVRRRAIWPQQEANQ
jgi:hypothetical protein